MSLARETAREEKASMFRDVRETLCVTWLCAFLEDTGAQVRVEGLKAEKVRQRTTIYSVALATLFILRHSNRAPTALLP